MFPPMFPPMSTVGLEPSGRSRHNCAACPLSADPWKVFIFQASKPFTKSPVLKLTHTISMKSLVSPPSYTSNIRIIAQQTRGLFLSVCLAFASLIFPAGLAQAINHPPFVSWIPDQRITTETTFATQYFRIMNYDAPGVTISVMKQSTNSNWYPASSVHVSPCTTQPDYDAGCADDGTGYKLTFDDPLNDHDGTTITIRAVESGMGGKIGYSSFTLRKDSTGGSYPASISNLPNRAVQVNSNDVAQYVTSFVVGDLGENGQQDICPDTAYPTTDEPCTASALPTPGVSASPATLFQQLDVTLNPSDPNLEVAAMQAPRSYMLTATTISNPLTTFPNGVATVTVNVTDLDGNITSTSFVLRVGAATNHEPFISNTNDKLWEEQNLPNETSVMHNFTVGDGDLVGNLSQLKVSAFSSNTVLVPNNFTENLIVTGPDVNGSGTVQVVPASALPSPSPGVPQAATITLSVTDDTYTRQTTFLYVLRDSTSPVISFSRPGGVYPTTQPDGDLALDTFLTGSMYNLQWDAAEMSEDGGYDWANTIDVVIGDLPANRDLSLGFQKEPCYIAENSTSELEFDTWCDTKSGDQPHHCSLESLRCTDSHGESGFLKAVPWDPHLRARRDLFLQNLATDLNENGGLAMSKISIINPNLPGADEGIRKVSVNFTGDCNNHPGNCMDGYTRERLLWAIQDELRTVQDQFPGKLIQFGFFEATDDLDSVHGDSPLWKWLYKDATADPAAIDENGVHVVALFDEFNGIRRPRLSFWQDNLAATRTSDTTVIPAIPRSSAPNYIAPDGSTAYTITPMLSFIPSFDYYDGTVTNETYNNGIVFEANTLWSNPFIEDQEKKLINTINGSPNDGMEGAFNTFLSQYLEIYVSDIDQAIPLSDDPPPLNATLWKGQLQSWHNYIDHLRTDVTPLDPPAGLTVERMASDNNLVKWHAVYGATSYSVQTITFGTTSPTWVDAVCEPGPTRECQDLAPKGAQYGYRVRASNGSITTDWAYVAVFLSEPDNDGYVQMNGTNKSAMPHATEPGIRAGNATGTTVLKGLLSFDTSALNGATVLTARLRLYEMIDSVFDASHPCHIDVKTGVFNGNVALEGNDFDALPTDADVAQLQPLESSPSTPLNWFEVEILPTYLSDINTSDEFGHTQFRLYFDSLTGTNKLAKWNAGDSVSDETTDRPPQLIVQYQP